MATKNDNDDCASAAQLHALNATFLGRGLSLRHSPQASALKWMAVREVTEAVTLPNGAVHLHERVELVAWSKTIGELITQLA